MSRYDHAVQRIGSCVKISCLVLTLDLECAILRKILHLVRASLWNRATFMLFVRRHVLGKIMLFQKFPKAVLVLLHVCEQVCEGSLDLLEVVRALAGIILARNPRSFLPLEELGCAGRHATIF